MKLQILIYSLIALFIITATVNAENLDDKRIYELLHAVDDMSASKNVEGIGEYLSDDLQITMYISILGNLQTHTANKEQYLAILSQGWEIAENYKYSREGVEITYLDEGKQARITATVHESMTIDGTPISSTTTEAAIVELRNGKALITKMTGETTM